MVARRAAVLGGMDVAGRVLEVEDAVALFENRTDPKSALGKLLEAVAKDRVVARELAYPFGECVVSEDRVHGLAVVGAVEIDARDGGRRAL